MSCWDVGIEPVYADILMGSGHYPRPGQGVQTKRVQHSGHSGSRSTKNIPDLAVRL